MLSKISVFYMGKRYKNRKKHLKCELYVRKNSTMSNIFCIFANKTIDYGPKDSLHQPGNGTLYA